MRFFLDTANASVIAAAMKDIPIAGVTTNPSLMRAEKKDPLSVLRALCALDVGPVSMEVSGSSAHEYVEQGMVFAEISSHVVIKIPCTVEGLKACRYFTENHIRTNATLCFSPLQALMAARSGATFVSPFMGRLDDVGACGKTLLQQIRKLYDTYSFTTEILAASVRHKEHILQACEAGANIVTLSASLLYDLYHHPLTVKGLEVFNHDWNTLTATL